MSWCYNCRSLNWSNDFELSPETANCILEYFDISLPRTMTCRTLKSTCEEFGIGSFYSK